MSVNDPLSEGSVKGPQSPDLCGAIELTMGSAPQPVRKQGPQSHNHKAQILPKSCEFRRGPQTPEKKTQHANIFIIACEMQSRGPS